MNWEAAGAVGEIVGALAVVLTLVYLARQLQANTASNQGVAISMIAAESRQHAVLDRESAAIFLKGIHGTENLDDEEKLIWNHHISTIMAFWLNVYMQHERGLIPQELWDSYAHDIGSYFQHRGVQEVWGTIANAYPEDYRKFVTKASMTDTDVDFTGQS